MSPLGGTTSEGRIDEEPKFAKRYGNVNEVATQALTEFVADVGSGIFPDDEHSYGMSEDEAATFALALEEMGRGGSSLGKDAP